MTFRRVLRFAVVCSIAGSFTACGESGGSGETQTTTGSPNDTSGAPGTDNAGTDGTGTGTSPANTTSTNTGGPAGTEPPDEQGTGEQPDDPNPGFCPEAQPEEGGECMNAFPVACTYGELGCICGEGGWDCYSASDCPAAAPAEGDACELGGMACSYDGLACNCDTEDGWSCSSPCPEAQPSDGGSCRRPTNQSCNYAGGELAAGFMSMADTTCACTDGTFVCFSEENCPVEPPSTGGSCEFPTLDCVYEGSDCACNADGTWDCRTDCPDMFPDDGASCERPEQAVCRYSEEGTILQGGMGGGMGGAAVSTCACTEGAFVCIGSEDCPTAAPTTSDACAGLEGLACDYETSSCSCGDMGWSCQTDCPAAPPEEGVSCERNANQACRYAAGELLAGGGGFGGGGGTQADTSCSCVENAFDCFTPADCPTTLPGEDVECSVTGVRCVVEGQNCTCNGQTDTWNCATPPDPGVETGTEDMNTSGSVTSAPSSEAPTSEAATSEAPADADAGAP